MQSVKEFRKILGSKINSLSIVFIFHFLCNFSLVYISQLLWDCFFLYFFECIFSEINFSNIIQTTNYNPHCSCHCCSRFPFSVTLEPPQQLCLVLSGHIPTSCRQRSLELFRVILLSRSRLEIPLAWLLMTRYPINHFLFTCSPCRSLPKECFPRRRQPTPPDILLSHNSRLLRRPPLPSLFTHTGDASRYALEPSVCQWDAYMEIFSLVAAVSWSSWLWRAAEQEVCPSARSTDSWQKTSLILR